MTGTGNTSRTWESPPAANPFVLSLRFSTTAAALRFFVFRLCFFPRCFLSTISETSHFRGRGKGEIIVVLRSRDALRACVHTQHSTLRFPFHGGVGKVIRHVDGLRVRAHVCVAVPVSRARKKETERETEPFENGHFNCRFVACGLLFFFLILFVGVRV